VRLSHPYHDGHYAYAVEDAVKALNGVVRLRSGLDIDGTGPIRFGVLSREGAWQITLSARVGAETVRASGVGATFAAAWNSITPQWV
jgi:hypothetical protein